MKQELFEFLHGERNAIRGDLIIGRERTATSEYYYVSSPEEDNCIPILKGWAKKIKPKLEPLVTIKEVGLDDAPKQTRHTTGGKPGYVMLMQYKSAVMDKLSIVALGVLTKLIYSGCVEWGTGRLVNKRSKKPLDFKAIALKIGLKTAETKGIIAELTANKVLSYNRSQKAYFLDRSLIKKGGGQNEGEIQKGNNA